MTKSGEENHRGTGRITMLLIKDIPNLFMEVGDTFYSQRKTIRNEKNRMIGRSGILLDKRVKLDRN